MEKGAALGKRSQSLPQDHSLSLNLKLCMCGEVSHQWNDPSHKERTTSRESTTIRVAEVELTLALGNIERHLSLSH